MTAVVSERIAAGSAEAGDLPALRAIVLVRVAAEGGVTRAGLVRDLTAMTAHRFSPAEWRARAEIELTALLAARLVGEARGRFEATERGRAAADAFLGGRPSRQSWGELRDAALVAKALGLEGESASNIKALGKPDGLRALIVQQAFRLPLKGQQSASRLRAELAVVALERAFGNKIKRRLGAGSAFAAKAGRVLAGELSRTPQDYGSDGRLVAALAAEQAGAVQTDEDSLRLALLRRLVTRALMPAEERADTVAAAALMAARLVSPAPEPRVRRAEAAPAPLADATRPDGARADATRPPAAARPASPRAANDTVPLAGARPPVVAAARPDMETFVAEVKAAASACAEGWPGNRKAFISLTWQAIRSARADWGLSEIEFKCMLAEAHRAGHVALATADLKSKTDIAVLQASAIPFKNTVWHFVRVDE